MKITKELKYATFEYDEEEKDFVIEEEDGNKVIHIRVMRDDNSFFGTKSLQTILEKD